MWFQPGFPTRGWPAGGFNPERNHQCVPSRAFPLVGPIQGAFQLFPPVVHSRITIPLGPVRGVPSRSLFPVFSLQRVPSTESRPVVPLLVVRSMEYPPRGPVQRTHPMVSSKGSPKGVHIHRSNPVASLQDVDFNGSHQVGKLSGFPSRWYPTGVKDREAVKAFRQWWYTPSGPLEGSFQGVPFNRARNWDSVQGVHARATIKKLSSRGMTPRWGQPQGETPVNPTRWNRTGNPRGRPTRGTNHCGPPKGEAPGGTLTGDHPWVNTGRPPLVDTPGHHNWGTSWGTPLGGPPLGDPTWGTFWGPPWGTPLGNHPCWNPLGGPHMGGPPWGALLGGPHLGDPTWGTQNCVT
jgi:hypothetical protein